MAVEVRAWVEAARPRTLAASVVPVAMGSALAAHDGRFSPSLTAATLAAALLIQVGTNLINDVYDFLRGADDEHRLGPSRASQTGAIDVRTLRRAAWLVLAAAAVCGAVLVAARGWPILLIGVVSLGCAWAYTAGPWPLAYHGLGDLFVWIFFGPVAVVGSYYVNTAETAATAWLASVSVGCLAAAILAVNNLRDIAGDARAGKNTLAVRLGDPATRAQYGFLLSAAFVAQGALAAVAGGAFVPGLGVAVLAAYEIARLDRREGAALNASLAGTARLLLVYGVVNVVALLR